MWYGWRVFFSAVALSAAAGCGSTGGSADDEIGETAETGADGGAESSDDLGRSDAPDVADGAEEEEDAAEGETGAPDADADADGDGGGDEASEGRRFSFALMTDLHVGEGRGDYGTAGWDDSGGDEDERTATLRFAVSKVNMADEEYDIRFVMVTGDLSDSGERSELLKAREILEQLHVPYFPLLGNHDVWPYASGSEAPDPRGDRFFEEVFAEHFVELQALFPSLVRAPTPVFDPGCGCTRRFINYSFDVEGYHFVALDLVTRNHAPLWEPGVTSEADLYDFPGGTWRWFQNDLDGYPDAGDRNIFVFSHHPPLVTTLGILDCLTIDEVNAIDEYIRDRGLGPSLFGFFAGHHHLNYDVPAYDGQRIVVTAATKDGATVRVIQLFPGGVTDYGTFL